MLFKNKDKKRRAGDRKRSLTESNNIIKKKMEIYIVKPVASKISEWSARVNVFKWPDQMKTPHIKIERLTQNHSWIRIRKNAKLKSMEKRSIE